MIKGLKKAKAILDSNVYHLLEIRGDYLCRYKDTTYEKVIYVELDQSHIDEILEIADEYEDNDYEIGRALDSIIEGDLDIMAAKSPSDMIEAFEENVFMHDVISDSPEILTSFECYEEKFDEYWTYAQDYITPGSEYPNSQQLRAAWVAFKKRVADWG